MGRVTARSSDQTSRTRIAFVDQVRDALAHLHDPTHLERHPLARRTPPASGHPLASPGRTLHQALLAAIESLRPAAEMSGESHAQRSYQILTLRYVEALEPTEIVARLAISRSELFRVQGRAIEAVAAILWERLGLAQVAAPVLVSRATDPRRPPLLTLAAPPPTNLLARLTSFVGREEEAAELGRRLRSTRLLALVSAGGAGKTRLAEEVARDARVDFADGVWLVDLAPLADPALVPQAVGTVLGLREEGSRPFQETLVETLRDRRLLLVLDNCEHLVAAVALLVDALLRAGPGLRILATSREPLGVAGEMVWRVAGLALPDPSTATPDRVELSPAAQLFCERARSLAPNFALLPDDAVALAWLCYRLDGLPLALELAAAWVPVLPVGEILARVDDSPRFLVRGRRSDASHHQSLRAAVDWSVDLLTGPQRALFLRLSVFAGGFALDAAEAVGVGPEVGREDVLGLLAQLVEKSLVVAERGGTGAMRYRLLETLRQYGWDRAVGAGVGMDLARQHGRHYLSLVEAADAHRSGPAQAAWLRRLDQEYDNLRVALRWAAESGPAELSLALAAGLGGYWLARGYLDEGRRWIERTLAREAGVSPILRATCLDALGKLLQAQGNYGLATDCLEQSVNLFRELGETDQAALALADLATALYVYGDRDRAHALSDESIHLLRELADRHGLAQALAQRGDRARIVEGDLDQARALYEESLALSRQAGDERAIGTVLRSLGIVGRAQGDLDRARRLTEESLGIARNLGDRHSTGWALFVLGYVVGLQGDDVRSDALLAESLILLRAIGARLHLSVCLCFGGLLAVKRGKHARGVLLLAAADRHPSLARQLTVDVRAAWPAAIAEARSALGDARFDGLWAEGHALTDDEAIALATTSAS